MSAWVPGISSALMTVGSYLVNQGQQNPQCEEIVEKPEENSYSTKTILVTAGTVATASAVIIPKVLPLTLTIARGIRGIKLPETIVGIETQSIKNVTIAATSLAAVSALGYYLTGPYGAALSFGQWTFVSLLQHYYANTPEVKRLQGELDGMQIQLSGEKARYDGLQKGSQPHSAVEIAKIKSDNAMLLAQLGACRAQGCIFCANMAQQH